jgi:hypothetical protein
MTGTLRLFYRRWGNRHSIRQGQRWLGDRAIAIRPGCQGRRAPHRAARVPSHQRARQGAQMTLIARVTRWVPAGAIFAWVAAWVPVSLRPRGPSYRLQTTPGGPPSPRNHPRQSPLPLRHSPPVPGSPDPGSSLVRLRRTHLPPSLATPRRSSIHRTGHSPPSRPPSKISCRARSCLL